jgi:hypothetical protein
VFNSDIRLPTNENIRKLLLQIGEEVQSEDYTAVGAIFEGDDAPVG